MTTSHEPGSPTIIAPQVLLGNHLKALKLPTFAREYEKVAMESAQDRADYPRYLLRLCKLERIDRERRNIERRIRLARFSQIKSLDTFDFAAQPSLNKPLVLELARCEWLEKRHNCIALGPSGTGKTHVALSLGLAACQKGYSVAFTSAAGLVHELMEARDERRLRALQKHLNAVKLLIVDELGYVPFTAVGSELLFEVFSQRYERGATLVTSNLPLDEWTSIFGSERLTGALLDRLTHHVHILEMNGESYRLATSKKAQRRSAQEKSQNPKTPNEGDFDHYQSTETNAGASQPFSLNPTGTLSRRHLAQFVSGIDSCRAAEDLALRQHEPPGADREGRHRQCHRQSARWHEGQQERDRRNHRKQRPQQDHQGASPSSSMHRILLRAFRSTWFIDTHPNSMLLLGPHDTRRVDNGCALARCCTPDRGERGQGMFDACAADGPVIGRCDRRRHDAESRRPQGGVVGRNGRDGRRDVDDRSISHGHDSSSDTCFLGIHGRCRADSIVPGRPLELAAFRRLWGRSACIQHSACAPTRN
jgi:DNA replication protein DnaC